MPEQNLDTVILWVDDSEKSREARELLLLASVEFEERTVDPAKSDDSLLDPPTLQSYNYRFSGLSMIRNMVNDPYRDVNEFLSSDRDYYLAKVEMEEKLKSPNPWWPHWSVRYPKAKV